MVTNKWINHEHALAYLAQADAMPHRAEGERVGLEQIPDWIHRVLDLEPATAGCCGAVSARLAQRLPGGPSQW